MTSDKWYLTPVSNPNFILICYKQPSVIHSKELPSSQYISYLQTPLTCSPSFTILLGRIIPQTGTTSEQRSLDVIWPCVHCWLLFLHHKDFSVLVNKRPCSILWLFSSSSNLKNRKQKQRYNIVLQSRDTTEWQELSYLLKFEMYELICAKQFLQKVVLVLIRHRSNQSQAMGSVPKIKDNILR